MKRIRNILGIVVLGAVLVGSWSSPALAINQSPSGYVCSVVDSGSWSYFNVYTGKGCTGTFVGTYYLSQSAKPEPVYSQTVNRIQLQAIQQKYMFLYSDASGNVSYIVYYGF